MDSSANFMVEDIPPDRVSMRIAVVTETWPPEINGVALTLSRLVQGLSARHHSIQLIRTRQDRQDSPLEHASWSEMLFTSFPIPKYPQLRMGLPSKKALLRAWTLKRPDLVHIATEGPLGWSALQAARKLRIAVTSDFRTNFHRYSKHYGVGWLSKPIVAYLRKFHNMTAVTMVPTHSLKNELKALGFENLKVVARGVDTTLFHPDKRDPLLRQEWGAEDDSLILLSAGRLAAEKNLELVVQTFEAMKSSGTKLKLVIAGDGPYASTLRELCPDAIFMGMCDQKKLARIYASSDVFIFPSLTETFGNVTLEALASGTPVLAFDCAAAAELLLHKVNGWLVDGESGADFVKLACALTMDVPAVMAMRETTRLSAQSLDWNVIAAQVEDVFLRTFAESHRRHSM